MTEPGIEGRNGVVIARRPPRETTPRYRTYEVHQRERVGESTEKIKPIQLLSDDYRRNPYPLLEILREHYPFYRDWLGNRYWLTPYNDVTSVFVDDANFETRPKTWFYGLEGFGRNLGDELSVLEFEAGHTDNLVEGLAASLADRLASRGEGDIATEFAAQLPLDLLCEMYAIAQEDRDLFCKRYWRAQRGTSWRPDLQNDGRQALDELLGYFEPLVEERRSHPGEDLVSVMLQHQPDEGPVTAGDVVVTLLERDHETLHGALANLWYLLLTHPEEFEKARSDGRLMKLGYLETLRHSTPAISALRFARHEVERFGKLIPEGALVVCSAGAANRDPRVFNDPDRFVVDRRDLCQREPRGQYRADGLATGIAFGLGKPSSHPAIPEDRPRSKYALTRDTAVTASWVLSETLQNMSLAPGAEPELAALTVGEMHTCWSLPVRC